MLGTIDEREQTMTTIDPNKTIQKYRREEEMRKALLQLLERKHTLSVPPQVEDADIVLSDVIEELLEARKKLALLEPLRDSWISELERRETLRNRGDSWKVIDPPMVPLSPVETHIRDTDSAIATREEAEQAANAELTPYRSLPTSSLLYQIPVISTQEELREAKRKGEQYIFVANPGDSLKDIEKLREPAKDEEQVIDLPLSIPEETTSTTVYRGVGRSDGIYLGRGRWLEL